MRLIDEEDIENQKIKNQKTKKLIMITVILLVILCFIIVTLIAYRVNNPTQITTYIDGVKVSGFDQILDFDTDENGETQIYIPIRDFATYLNAVDSDFGYQTFKGDYSPKTEEEDKCHVIRPNYEMALYQKKSKVIYILNLQNSTEDYEECYIDKDVFENNGKLYASVDGIEKGYNVSFSYDEKKKVIQIYTLDYLINSHITKLANQEFDGYGTLQLNNIYSDWKSIYEGILIVQASNGKYGLTRADDYSNFILEPQYDSISFVRDSSTFLVSSDGKIGLFTKDGKRKIDLAYDEITSMGQNSNLYVVKTNGMQGVVDENGKIVIYPEYDEVGISVNSFSYNDVKNGYILLGSVIPVKKDNSWAFFNKSGKMVTDGFKYQNIGCASVPSANNIYPLLEIPDYNVIVVSDEYGKYAFVNTDGSDSILNFLFDAIYIKTSEGEKSYWMTFRGNEYDVLKYLKQPKESNLSQNTTSQNQTTNNTVNNTVNNTK